MSSIHYFNPGHETAILHGSENYTPAINVQRMTRELSMLPVWYAGEEDYVFTDAVEYPERLYDGFGKLARPISQEKLFSLKNSLPMLTARPWGYSPHSCGLFRRLAQKKLPIVYPEWKEDYKRLTGRQTAAGCLSRLKEAVKDVVLPDVPVFCTTIDEAEAFLKQHRRTAFVLKSPFSSSGRGVLWIRGNEPGVKDKQWMAGILKRQQAFSIEPALDKVQDFAMEFYSDGEGNVRYEGLSVFSTAEQGAYSGNLLGAQDRLWQQLSPYGIVDELLRYRDLLIDILQEVYGPVYEGYLGVDMLVYKETENNAYHIHPCVEINMRYTMGLVALQISKRLIAQNSKGFFSIEFNGKEGETFQKHNRLQTQYPLRIVDKKIVSGYMSLCPVCHDSGYLAYVLVENDR